MTLRLAFMGTPDFAVPTLAELIAQGHDIVAVYSQPPRPKGRGMALEPGPVHTFAQSAGLEVRTPLSLKDADEQAAFAALNIDAAFSALLLVAAAVAMLSFFPVDAINWMCSKKMRRRNPHTRLARLEDASITSPVPVRPDR